MIASELISDLVMPLMTSDTGEEALTLMSINHVKHLPIVNDTQLLGLISESDILAHDLNEPIGSYQLSLVRPYAFESEHLFEIMSKMAASNLTVIPVVDKEEVYKGLITQEDLIQFYASSFSFTEPGSIIILETNKREYSLADISRIIESENASILSSFLTSEDNSTSVTVTLKVNRQEINRIISALERYEYSIKGSFTEEEYFDELKDRYDALMTYLNV
jgi:signal-transduction protein with cAMP-binding, CBS, and nucleotidyltransferase domain